MKWSEYLIEAPKTCNPEAWNVYHFCELIADEAGELIAAWKKRHYGKNVDFTNVKEELGDLSWGMACFWLWYFGKDTSPVWAPKEPSMADVSYYAPGQVRRIFIAAGRVIEELEHANCINMNKNIEFTQHMKDQIHRQVCGVQYWADCLVKIYRWNWEEIWEVNIRKLRARYGETFDSDKAVDRDPEAERKALEEDA